MLDGNVASVRWLSSIMVDPPNKQCLSREQPKVGGFAQEVFENLVASVL